jgi:hypothetical protein
LIGLLFDGLGPSYAQPGEVLYRWLVQSKELAEDLLRVLTEIGRVAADIQTSVIETVWPPLDDLAVLAPDQRLASKRPLPDQGRSVAHGCGSQARSSEYIGCIRG